MKPEMTSAESVAARFVVAVSSGDERSLWNLFSDAAHRRIIDVGERQGLPAVLAGKVRSGTAAPEEMERFLVDVLDGLRRDLEWSTVSALRPEVVESSTTSARVALIEPLTVEMPGSPAGLPAAWLAMTCDAGRWVIDRIDLPGR